MPVRPVRDLFPALGLAGLAALGGCASGTSGGGAAPTVGTSAPQSTVREAQATPTPTPAVGTDTDDDAVAVTDAPRPTGATDVVLGYAAFDPGTDAVVAGGYVSPVLQDGGTCTLVLTGGGRTVRAEADGVADATTTVCGGLSVPHDRLAAGTWTVVLEYSSAAASGRSQELSVEVPA